MRIGVVYVSVYVARKQLNFYLWIFFKYIKIIYAGPGDDPPTYLGWMDGYMVHGRLSREIELGPNDYKVSPPIRLGTGELRIELNGINH